jgi:hypothetical protein
MGDGSPTREKTLGPLRNERCACRAAPAFYGWAKAAYEPLGFLYACGSLGRKLEVVQIRIVVPREIDASLFENEPPERYVRELAGL